MNGPKTTQAFGRPFGTVGRRVIWMTLGSAALAALLSVAVLADPEVRPEQRIPWLVVAAAVLCADLIVIDFPAAGNSLRLEMSAIPVAVGAVFTGAAGLLAATATAAAVSVVVRRQFGRVAMTVATQLAAVCLCELALWFLLGGHRPRPVGGLVLVGVGVLVYEAAGVGGALAALSAARRAKPCPQVRSVMVQVGLIVSYNAVMAVLAVLIGLQDIWGLLLLALPAAFFGLWYRSVSEVRRRYESIQHLYGFTAQLADLPDTEAIVTAALALCRQLLACRHAHLVVQGAGRATRWELPDGGDRATLVDAGSVTDEECPPLELDVFGVDGAVLVRNSRSLSPARMHDDVMAAPVPLGQAEAGVLVVTNRSEPGHPFDRDDLRLFEALSAHLGTALTSSRRLEQLQSVVAEREHQALHDGLTGLANRTLFTQWVSRELVRCPEQRCVAVLVMDLNGFKDINDSLGHRSGDLVLREVATRLDRLCRPGQMTARLGGDEFALVVPDLADAAEAVAVATAVAEEVARPLPVGDMPLDVRTSIGISVAPEHGSDPATLLQRADVAMYAAKAARRPSSVYDAEMERGTKRRLTLGSSLRQALDSGRIEVWYQPVARSATGWISGCEALLRWRDEEGFVPPSEFIPIAEHTGLIERLTWWTLETALEELRGWRGEDLCPSVAVNLSPRCLQAPDVIQRVSGLLVQSDIPPSALTLEITESLIMSDPDLAEELLNQLGIMGVRVAVDDFGTGYSSLSRLKRLPVDTIKIDRDFVMNMHADRDDEAIVKATLELARTLGCSVVAEGVETFEAWHQLQAFGCQQIQGFILAAPMPAEECRQWLRSRKNLLAGPSASSV